MQKVIKLADLRPPLSSVDLGAEGTHAVQHATGHIIQMLGEVKRAENGLRIWDVAAQLVPTASKEAILALSLAEVEEILAIATGRSALEQQPSAG